MSFLQQAFQEFSILWLILSGAIGGVIGALIKFLFEEILQTRYRRSIDSRSAIRKYTYPILRAADTLDRRLENYIRFIDRDWFRESERDYYKVSTLYIFGCYFGWCKILEDEAFLEYEASNRRARDFSIRFNTVFKSITNYSYFQESNIDIQAIQAATPPRFALTAIGELMIKQGEKDNVRKEIISFTEFTKHYSESDDFKKWFFFVERMFGEVSPSESNANWNRILVFASIIRAFVLFLDKSSRQTAPRTIWYLNKLHPEVAVNLRRELTSLKMDKKIEEGSFGTARPAQ